MYERHSATLWSDSARNNHAIVYAPKWSKGKEPRSFTRRSTQIMVITCEQRTGGVGVKPVEIEGGLPNDIMY